MMMSKYHTLAKATGLLLVRMPLYIGRGDSEEAVLAATIYAEARGEGYGGMQAVAHVMKNRANANRGHWGGSSVRDVCLREWQFECWNGRESIEIHEMDLYNQSLQIARDVLAGRSQDPTGGCDHYNNPHKENADWVHRVRHVMDIGNHRFYKE